MRKRKKETPLAGRWTCYVLGDGVCAHADHPST